MAVCRNCKDGHHHLCRGGTWCDCQHQPPASNSGDWPINNPPTPEESDDPNASKSGATG